VGGDHRSEVVHPAADRLVRDHNSALGEQILDVAEAEREPQIKPNRLMYDLRREPISSIADFPHAPRLPRLQIQQVDLGVTKPSPAWGVRIGLSVDQRAAESPTRHSSLRRRTRRSTAVNHDLAAAISVEPPTVRGQAGASPSS